MFVQYRVTKILTYNDIKNKIVEYYSIKYKQNIPSC